jgi:threonyl-tRNA synthetase
VGEDSEWVEATESLRRAATKQNLELVLDEGGAAFYGPKISVQAKDAIGRTWQMSTIQVDFQLPQRFELEYVANDSTRQRPVMIHRALFGSIERFADTFTDYLDGVMKQMRAAGIRVDLDTSDDRMQKKVRNAQMQKIPFMVIAGEEDVSAGAVSFRYRNGEQKNGIPIAQAIKEIQKAVHDRIQV